jgi:hypothetical protein
LQRRSSANILTAWPGRVARKPECGACNTKMVEEGVDYRYSYNPLYVNTPGAPAWCMHLYVTNR